MVPGWWQQYDDTVLLFVLTTVILSYYWGSAVRASTDEKNRVLKKKLTEYVFMTGIMFVVSSKNVSASWYYTFNPMFDHLNGGVLFRLSDKILDVLMYVGLYRFELSLGTDPVRIALAAHRCSDLGWMNTALQDGFVLYDFESDNVFRSEEEVVPAS